MIREFPCYLSAVALFLPFLATAHAETDEELAKKLQNPIASLISVPFQNNFDFGGGYNDQAFRYTLNFQPVIPISLGPDWNIISRTILPFIQQNGVIPRAELRNAGAVAAGTELPRIKLSPTSQTGLGDITQSLFLSPVKPLPGGIIAGVGPVFLIPTATLDVLGTGQFGMGPTAVLLKQTHGWTTGILANHIWSVAGERDRADVNATFLQPFLSYTFKTSTSITLNSESSYDWTNRQWLVPLNLMVSQVVKIGGLPVNFQAGAKYYAEGPNGAPDWGVRFTITPLFPTGGPPTSPTGK